jgi:hypothetical protein
MTYEQQIFAWLRERPPASVREVAAAFPFIEPRSVAKVVERLRNKGHLALHPAAPTYSVPPGTPAPIDRRGR